MSTDSVPTTEDPTRAELIETVNVLSDPAAMTAIAEGEAELATRQPERRITFANLLNVVEDLSWAAHQEAQAGHHDDAARLASLASTIKQFAYNRPSAR